MASTPNNEHLDISENITDFEKLTGDIDNLKGELSTDIKKSRKYVRKLKKKLVSSIGKEVLQEKSVDVLKLDQESSVNLPALLDVTCSAVSRLKEMPNGGGGSHQSSLDETKAIQKITTNFAKCRRQLRSLARCRILLQILVPSDDDDFQKKKRVMIDDTIRSFQGFSLNGSLDNIVTSSPFLPTDR